MLLVDVGQDFDICSGELVQQRLPLSCADDQREVRKAGYRALSAAHVLGLSQHFVVADHSRLAVDAHEMEMLGIEDEERIRRASFHGLDILAAYFHPTEQITSYRDALALRKDPISMTYGGEQYLHTLRLKVPRVRICGDEITR